MWDAPYDMEYILYPLGRDRFVHVRRICEHSNIEHLNVQKLANTVEHSNTNVRRSVTPVR